MSTEMADRCFVFLTGDCQSLDTVSSIQNLTLSEITNVKSTDNGIGLIFPVKPNLFDLQNASVPDVVIMTVSKG